MHKVEDNKIFNVNKAAVEEEIEWNIVSVWL